MGLRQHRLFSHDFVMQARRNNLARPCSRFKAKLYQIIVMILVVLLAPLLLMLATLVASDGGPVFYRHRRIGEGGRNFGSIKFRTMAIVAERVLDHVPATDAVAAAARLGRRKLLDDLRIMPLGRFLRRAGLDELPQRLNVLGGDMSISGPRPIAQSQIVRYGGNDVKPSLAGLWQVSRRSDTSCNRRVHFDMGYVRDWTLWHDIAILLKTNHAVFLQRGAQ
jgi:UDP-galactose-lipid carrier transferase